MALLGYRPFGPDPPRSALHAYEPHPWLTCLIGNQHGSRRRSNGSWGCSGGAQQNAGSARRRTRNHPGGPETSSMPGQLGPPPGCRWDRPPDTSPRSSPTHFRACRRNPTDWHYTDLHHESA
ncbi:hypothetical protein OAO16_00510 [Opitutales bacterium]|nr:hypothetical protein [Opitutales bacterium]